MGEEDKVGRIIVLIQISLSFFITHSICSPNLLPFFTYCIYICTMALLTVKAFQITEWVVVPLYTLQSQRGRSNELSQYCRVQEVHLDFGIPTVHPLRMVERVGYFRCSWKSDMVNTAIGKQGNKSHPTLIVSGNDSSRQFCIERLLDRIGCVPL